MALDRVHLLELRRVTFESQFSLNARAELFMRTLKEEEVYGKDYQNLEDARSQIGEFLEQVYNRKRLHSALSYLTPEEFEQASEATGSDGADGSGGAIAYR